MSDEAIARLFSQTPSMADNDVFEARVMMRLRLKLWLKQALVVLTGIICGVYALAQFVSLPESVLSATSAEAAPAQAAKIVSSGTWSEFDFLTYSAPYLSYMQTSGFFWLSFALCGGCLALYFFWSQEETI